MSDYLGSCSDYERVVRDAENLRMWRKVAIYALNLAVGAVGIVGISLLMLWYVA